VPDQILEKLQQIDFTKQINMTQFLRQLDSMELSEEEELTAKSPSDILLILKLVIYKIGIMNERNKILSEGLETTVTDKLAKQTQDFESVASQIKDNQIQTQFII
jgi:hypothetical protein